MNAASQTQQPPEPHPPSPPDSAHFNATHFAINATRIAAFKRNHAHIVTTLTPPKFVYVPHVHAGFGNKMNSLLSGFLVAMLTNSALIVNWTHVDKYIQEPMPLVFLTNSSINNELNYLYSTNETFKFPYMTFNSFRPNKNLAKLYHKLPAKYTRFTFAGIGPLFYELAADTDHFATWRQFGFVRNSTLHRAASILANRHNLINRPLTTNNDTLNAVYSVGFELAHNILGQFWRVRPELAAEVAHAVRHNSANGSLLLIGMQLRSYYLTWEDTLVFAGCAEAIERRLGRRASWFVTSDDEANLRRFKSLYAERVWHGKGRIAHVDKNKNGYARTLFDLEVLSVCDEVIMTGGSTFGFLGALKSGRYPLFVEGRRNATRCERFAFSNPSLTRFGASVV